MKEVEKSNLRDSDDPAPKHRPVHEFYKQPTEICRSPEGELGHSEIEHGCSVCIVHPHQVDLAQSLTVVSPTDLFSISTTADKRMRLRNNVCSFAKHNKHNHQFTLDNWWQ